MDIPRLGSSSVPEKIFDECLTASLRKLHFDFSVTDDQQEVIFNLDSSPIFTYEVYTWFSVDTWPELFGMVSQGTGPKILNHPFCGHFISGNGEMGTKLGLYMLGKHGQCSLTCEHTVHARCTRKCKWEGTYVAINYMYYCTTVLTT